MKSNSSNVSSSELPEYLPYVSVTAGVVLFGILFLVVFVEVRKRRQNRKRRKRFAETLRTGDMKSVDDLAVPDGSQSEGEPEDIKELFYYYWRQGTNQLDQNPNRTRPKSQVELVEPNVSSPRRQTVSGARPDVQYNSNVNSIHRPCFSGKDHIRDERYRKYSESLQMNEYEHDETDFGELDYEPVYDFCRRGVKRSVPSCEDLTEQCKSLKSERKTRNSVDGSQEWTDAFSCNDVDSFIRDKSNTKDNDKSDCEALYSVDRGTGNGNDICGNSMLAVVGESEPQRSAKVVRRMYSCHEPNSLNTSTKSWSFMSLLLAWDFKKAVIDTEICDSDG